MVSDEVWAKLDPRAGQLSGRGVAMVWLVIFAAVNLSIASAGAAEAGVFTSRINVNLQDSRPHTPYVEPIVVTPGRITFKVALRNYGHVPVTVVALGSAARPLASPVSWPLKIAAGQQVEVQLAYDIPDCSRFPLGPYTFPIQVRHWWGIEHSTVTLDLGLGMIDPDLRHSCQPAA